MPLYDSPHEVFYKWQKKEARSHLESTPILINLLKLVTFRYMHDMSIALYTMQISKENPNSVPLYILLPGDTNASNKKLHWPSILLKEYNISKF